MKHIKKAALVLIAVLVAAFAAGCAGSGSSTGTTGGKGNGSDKILNSTAESNTPMTFLQGTEKDMIICNNQVTELPGKITDACFTDDHTVLYYILDGELYLNVGGRSNVVDQCVDIIDLDWDNAVCMYRAEDNDVKLYSPKTGEIVTYTLPNGYASARCRAISPDGSAFAYRDTENGYLMLCRDGECITLEKDMNIKVIAGVSDNGELVYVYERLTSDLYCYRSSGEKTLLWSRNREDHFIPGVEFNADKTQILLKKDNNTYFSENAEPAVFFAAGYVEPMLDKPANDLYGQLYVNEEGAVTRIERNSECSRVLLSAEDVYQVNVRLDQSEKYIIYQNYQMEFRYVSADIRENAAQNSILIFTENTDQPLTFYCPIYFSEDFSFAYFVTYEDSTRGETYTLQYGDPTGNKKIAEVYEQAGWGGGTRLAGNGKGIYYSNADGLYYYDGNTSMLLADGPHKITHSGSFLAYKYSLDEDGYLSDHFEAVYLVHDDHTMQQLPVEDRSE